MHPHTCRSCSSKISPFAKVCPNCRLNPYNSAEENRRHAERDADRRFDSELRKREQSERRLHREFSSGGNSGGASTSSKEAGCFGILAVLFVIGLIISFFQWLGGQISLRFGEEMLLPMSALLVIWMVAAIAVFIVGADKEWSVGKTLGPSIGWVVAMLLIMFLPANVGLGGTDRGVAPGSSAIQIAGDSQAAADQAASLAIAADMATLPPAPQPVIDLGVAEVPVTPAEPPISEMPQDAGLSVSTEVAPGQAEEEEPSVVGVHEGAL